MAEKQSEMWWRDAERLVSLGSRHYLSGSFLQARAQFQIALSFHRRARCRLGEANCIWLLGRVHQALGELPQAQACYEQALPLYRQEADRQAEANCLRNLGDVHLSLAGYPQARAQYEPALVLCRELEDRVGEAHCLHGLGRTHWMLAEFSQAEQRFRETLALYRHMGYDYFVADTCNQLGLLSKSEGNRRDALRYTEAAAELFEEMGVEHLAEACRARAEAWRAELGA